MTRVLTTEDQAAIEHLRRLAYERAVDGGEFVAGYEETRDDDTNRKVYEAWLAQPPADLVFFCRLAASSHRLCSAGQFNTARTQVHQDFMTNRVPQVYELVERVPEIMHMIRKVLRDNERLAHTLYVLSHLLPQDA